MDKLDAAAMAAVNGPEDGLLDWDSIDWDTAEKEVRRLRQRIFTASRDGDLRKVRNLQRLMLRCRSNALVAVRRVAQQNTGRHTAGVDGVVALWPEARSELAAAGGDAVSDQLVRTPIAVLDIEHEQLFLVSTETAVREGDSYHDEYGEEQWSSGRILKATKQVFIVPREFVLAAVSGRYASPGRPDYTAGFRPSVEPERPWRIVTCLPDRAPLSRDVGNAPGHLLQWSSLMRTIDDGGSVTLIHLPTEQLWHLVVTVEVQRSAQLSMEAP